MRWWLAVWWAMESQRLAPSTRAQYARQVRIRIEPYLGDVLLADVDVAELSVWLDRLRADGHPAQQVARAQTVLSGCLRHAARRGLLPAGDPMPRLGTRVRTRRRRPRPLSPSQTEYLRLVLMTDDGRRGHARRALRSATLVSLLAYGGLRPSEAMGAKVGHLDPAAGGIWVSDVMSAEHRVDQTKTGDHRFVRLVNAVIADLDLWIEFARLHDPAGWLFPNRDGNVTPRTYPNWVNEIRRSRESAAAGRPEWRTEFDVVTPKTLRHTCASTRLRAGEPVAEVAADLGNSPRILLRWYTHEVRASRDQPIEPLAQQIARARSDLAIDLLARRLLLAPRRTKRSRRPRQHVAATGLALVGNRYRWETRAGSRP
ncbi:tyrosine-type recombinase/integrase [Conexibacter sp. JD483]|uniref:tyrosine-type recombinase/integrase n=1 Tax=unclassified Conexibacter TaxID=2627773 RepID=UPI0027261FF2|nr:MULTISPECIES: site-specific integrase [unclassified Conexibacter]MDO8202110.1 tyrosine-type recombinase/integrase [Conexibacter sp. CPCC 205762]MDR9372918.1 tyrosine-type recombinase/integrase [Conexibacter sp. JD483]